VVRTRIGCEEATEPAVDAPGLRLVVFFSVLDGLDERSRRPVLQPMR
jgi:hypothetical protein